jgi:CheY-like chemotaxis protein
MNDSMCILMVESDAVGLLAMTNALGALGVRCKRNTSGARVVEQAQTMNPRPTMIWINLDLPDVDALTVVAALGADAATASIPLIAICDEGRYARLGRAQRLFAGHLVYPVGRGAMEALVRPMMNYSAAGV